MKVFPLAKVFHLLEPGPTVLLATALEGRANVMAMSWHTMMEFEPPLVGCVVSAWNHSFAALRATGECVIAIPALPLAQKVVDIGNCSGSDTDKFAAFGLTRRPAARVRPPLVVECFANLECRVADDALADKYNFFILEVVKAWVDPKQYGPKSPAPQTLHHNGDGTFRVAGETLDLKAHMVKWPESA